MRTCRAAGPGSIPSRDKFPGWDFYLTYKTEGLGPEVPRISFGRHNHPFILDLLEGMGVRMACMFSRVCVVSEVAPALS